MKDRIAKNMLEHAEQDGRLKPGMTVLEYTRSVPRLCFRSSSEGSPHLPSPLLSPIICFMMYVLTLYSFHVDDSGNTGIGLAMCCAAKGYKCIIVMPQLPSYEERYMTCRMFGADVHLTAPAQGLPGLQEYTEQLISTQKKGSYFLTNQFYNAANPQMHYQTTGPEIWQQAGHVVDYFVTGVGTGGTCHAS